MIDRVCVILNAFGNFRNGAIYATIEARVFSCNRLQRAWLMHLYCNKILFSENFFLKCWNFHRSCLYRWRPGRSTNENFKFHRRRIDTSEKNDFSKFAIFEKFCFFANFGWFFTVEKDSISANGGLKTRLNAKLFPRATSPIKHEKTSIFIKKVKFFEKFRIFDEFLLMKCWSFFVKSQKWTAAKFENEAWFIATPTLYRLVLGMAMSIDWDLPKKNEKINF